MIALRNNPGAAGNLHSSQTSAGASASASFQGPVGVTLEEGMAMFFIDWHLTERGYSPTFQEIADYIGRPFSFVQGKIIPSLQAKGLIIWTRFGRGSLRLTHPINSKTITFKT
jgi:hypothetical protein